MPEATVKVDAIGTVFKLHPLPWAVGKWRGTTCDITDANGRIVAEGLAGPNIQATPKEIAGALVEAVNGWGRKRAGK